jgi:hypothetical protein
VIARPHGAQKAGRAATFAGPGKDPAQGFTDDVRGARLTALRGVAPGWAIREGASCLALPRPHPSVRPEIAEVAGEDDAGAALEALLRYIAATYERLKNEQIAEMVESAAGPEAQGRKFLRFLPPTWWGLTAPSRGVILCTHWMSRRCVEGPRDSHGSVNDRSEMPP